MATWQIIKMRPCFVQHGRNHSVSRQSELAVDHVALVGDDGAQDLALLALWHAEVVQRLGDLFAHLVELVRGKVQMLVRGMHILAGVVEGATGHFADPQRSHELEGRQLALLVPLHQLRVDVELGILEDFVAEAINHLGDGVDAAEPLVQALFCHRYSPLFSCAGWARTHEALWEAVRLALDAITPADARAWFAHVGYVLPAPA